MAIVRIHNTGKAFVVLDKEALWDSGLSLDAVGLWARLLSRPDDWEVRVSEICKSCKIGKDKAYKLLDELIEARLAFRYQRRKDGQKRGQFDCSETVIFREKQTEENIQKMFTDADFPNAALPNAENKDHTKYIRETNLSSSYEEEIKECNKGRKAPPSAEASALADFFLQKIKEKKEDFLPKGFKKWASDFEDMLTKDKRDPGVIRAVIQHLVSDLKNLIYVQSASKLREKFDVYEIAMHKDKEYSVVNANREYARLMKDKYPQNLKKMSFDTKFVRNIENAKEVPLNLNPESFKKTFLHIFGAEIYD